MKKSILTVMLIILVIVLSAIIYYVLKDNNINNDGYGCYTASECKDWARDNNIPIPDCIGYWICEARQCDYRCGVS